MTDCHEPGGRAPALGRPAGNLLIALAGPPNSGKTTLYNALTGSRFRTVNYPGATVEYSVGDALPQLGMAARVLDSPGLTSLNAHSPDEAVTVKALFHHPRLGTPDIVVVVADASQLSRHLYLVQQVLASGFRVVLAVTMVDLLREKGFDLDATRLASELACPVVPIDPRSGTGLSDLAARIVAVAEITPPAVPHLDTPTAPGEVRTLYDRAEAIEHAVLVPLGVATRGPLHAPDHRTLRLDTWLLHPLWGLLVFVLTMAGIFTAIFWAAAPAMDAIDSLFGMAVGAVHALLPGSWLGDFLADGIVAGIGSVAVFLPQIVILFLAMGFMEDSGYLARGAMLMDRPLARIGLNGRSFVPMLSGFACAIPAIMASRTIPNRRERLLTILVLPLMNCSARLPVFGLLLAFITPHDKPWLGGIGLTLIYLGSLVIGAAAATVASRFIYRQTEPSSFMLELPAYRRPQLRVVLRATFSRAFNYLEKATVPIVCVATALWALTYFPMGKTVGEDEAARMAGSYAAMLGHWLDPVMQPLGLDWRIGIALIAAFAAREVFVSALALVLRVSADGDALQGALLQAMQGAARADGTPLFTVSTALGLVVYFIVAMQCVTTFVVARKESGSTALAVGQLVAFNIVAYALAAITVHTVRALGIA
ncbi:MAG: ferrous iron transporter B [Candidatus Sericytochromatia bacterium]|nr:ferrous iron transporter B [Candidatus Tanganyikabacteria bacterium]